MLANELLSRLDMVRETGPDRWLARCSAHPDKNPSLSIRETGDGTLLLKCWAGCSAFEIVSAVGLELSDLFPPRPEHHSRIPEKRPFPASDALRAMTGDTIFLLICASDLIAGQKLQQDDLDHLAAIGGRLRATCNYLGVSP